MHADAADHVDWTDVDRATANVPGPQKQAVRPLNQLRPHKYWSAWLYVFYSLAAVVAIEF